MVFAHGEVAEVGREPWPEYDDDAIDFKGVVVRKLGALARHNSDMLTRRIARATRSRAGYALGRSATTSGIDLARLLVGSEGTLALVTEATLRTIPIPAAQAVALLPFARLGDAATAVAKCLEESPSACDLYDWRSLRLVRDAVPAFREWIPELAESVLIVEFEGDDPTEVADRIRRLTDRMVRSRLLVADPVEITRRAEAERLLHLRRVVEPLLMRMKGPARPVPFIEDVAVPPAALADFLQRLQNILKHQDVSWTLDAHAGLGLLRIRPFLDIADPGDLAKIEPLATQVVDAALDLGGAISGAHGCGLVRTQFLRRQFGDQVQVFREIKDAFDPLNVLNPGKVIGDDPHLITRNIKRMPLPAADVDVEAEANADEGAAVVPLILPVLRWTDRSPMETASACNGCGACRTSDQTARMCPTFRALGSEAATPRSKANLIRQLMAGTIDPKLWGTEELRQNADLCIHCNLCAKECPSGLDVSTLMLEAKAAYAENHGLPQVDWMLSRVDLWSRVASRFPIISNALLTNGTTALVVRADLRPGPDATAAEGASNPLRPPRGAAGVGSAEAPGAGSSGRLLCRCLCQLLRSGVGRSGRGRASSGGSQRVRAHRSARIGHAGPGRGRYRPRPRPGAGEPSRPR